jgi:Complex 1 protein (LYR family)
MAFASRSLHSATAAVNSSQSGLLSLYRKLLRACETYPSSNRHKIYQAIREEFRENRNLGVVNDNTADDAAANKLLLRDVEKRNQQIAVAYKGLAQLQQYSEQSLTGGRGSGINWSVTMEQNPMPKPPGYDEKRKQLKQQQQQDITKDESGRD